MSTPGELPLPTVHDPEAARAVERQAQDIFGFMLEPIIERKPTPVEAAAARATDEGVNLVEHHLLTADRKTRRQWKAGERIVLPTTPAVGGTPLHLSAQQDHEDGSVRLTLDRQDTQAASGFTLKRTRGLATFQLDATKDDILTDEAAKLLAIKEARSYMQKYGEAIGVSKWKLGQPPVVPSFRDKLHEKFPKGRLKRIGTYAGATAAFAALGAGCVNYLKDSMYKSELAREQVAIVDATYHLDSTTPSIKIGETKQITFGAHLNQDLIPQADGYYTQTDESAGSYNYFTNLHGHSVRTLSKTSMSEANGNTTQDCATIQIPGMSDQATIKVETTRPELANDMQVSLNRTEMVICNMKQNEPTGKTINEHEVFVEITDPAR